LSQEAEMRLDQSFRNEDLLPQILDLAYGSQTAGLLMLLGRCIYDATAVGPFSTKPSPAFIRDWMRQPYQCLQAAEAAGEILGTLRRKSEVSASKAPESLPEPMRHAMMDWGRRVAHCTLTALVDPPTHRHLGQDLQPVRIRLDALVKWHKESSKCAVTSPSAARKVGA
jgi:hypothetical protein